MGASEHIHPVTHPGDATAVLRGRLSPWLCSEWPGKVTPGQSRCRVPSVPAAMAPSRSTSGINHGKL